MDCAAAAQNGETTEQEDGDRDGNHQLDHGKAALCAAGEGIACFGGRAHGSTNSV